MSSLIPLVLQLKSKHTVADTWLSKYVGRVRGDFAQLTAEILDHGAHGPQVTKVLRSSDPLKQVIVGHHSPGVDLQSGEHPVLEGGQGYLLTG